MSGAGACWELDGRSRPVLRHGTVAVCRSLAASTDQVMAVTAGQSSGQGSTPGILEPQLSGDSAHACTQLHDSLRVGLASAAHAGRRQRCCTAKSAPAYHLLSDLRTVGLAVPPVRSCATRLGLCLPCCMLQGRPGLLERLLPCFCSSSSVGPPGSSRGARFCLLADPDQAIPVPHTAMKASAACLALEPSRAHARHHS